ncbi:MraY family glycosyltransferase [Pseudomonas sp. nanlin1]|uniref:MraY family glycosyltransferase n=1 Tax=Pseudomonas sp. nanlin1 TaxID=3040605 RepID=UPI00388EF48C
MLFLIIPLLAFMCWLLTGRLRQYAIAKSIIDIPNSRSSHTVPTPRGGGGAIVVVYLGSLPLLTLLGVLPWSVTWGMVGAGGMVAVLGFLDDRGHIAARWRLLGHFSASLWLLVWLGGLPILDIAGFSLDLGWFGHALALLYLVWLLNLYNFMDGIDGIASVEAICVGLGATVLYIAGGLPSMLFAPLALAVTVMGFLYWNFPPARIFMGDAGSGFLGITLGGLSLHAAWAAPQLLWGWLILLGVFVVDATLTLLRRLARGEKVYEAHRSHAYQFAARHYGRHLPVTLAVMLINTCWLLPIAIIAVVWRVDGLTSLALAYLPLVVLAIRFRAGGAE